MTRKAQGSRGSALGYRLRWNFLAEGILWENEITIILPPMEERKENVRSFT